MDTNTFINSLSKDNGLTFRCECYEDECIKRDLIILDALDGTTIKYKICNTIFKLAVQNIKPKYGFIYRYEKEIISELIEHIALVYNSKKYKFNFEPYKFEYFKKIKYDSSFDYLIEAKISIQLSNRPYVFTKISVSNLIEIYNNTNDYFIKCKALNLIKNSLIEVLPQFEYKSKKTQYTNLKRMINKLEDISSTENENALLSEIFSSFLEIGLNDKISNS